VMVLRDSDDSRGTSERVGAHGGKSSEKYCWRPFSAPTAFESKAV